LRRWTERADRNAVIILLAAGALARIVWLLLKHHLSHAGGEAANVAISLARTGVFGDTFARGSGASAHFTPSMQLVTAAVYSLLGVRTGPAEALLAVFSIGISLAGGWVWYRIFAELNVSRAVRLLALAVFCLLPLNPNLEAVSFRAWDGALASLLSGISLLTALRLDARDKIHFHGLLLISALCAITFYVNPAIALADYAAFGLILLRKVPPGRWPAAVGFAAVALAAVLTPWTIRNWEEFGRFIPLRSNFGIELALANHPAAASSRDEREVFLARLREIHPLESQSAFEKMLQAGGEAAFAQQLEAEAKVWIKNEPISFAQLSLHHWMQYYFPPQWAWDVYKSGLTHAIAIRQLVAWVLAAFGLFCAIWMPFRFGSRFLFVSCAILMPALPYMIVQPVPRYRYLVFAPMLFSAVFFLWIQFGAMARRFREEQGLQEAYEIAN
jgi:hypothetical protein